jgi:polyvinyl alcohol dehydrogenase (cytochrome)
VRARLILVAVGTLTALGLPGMGMVAGRAAPPVTCGPATVPGGEWPSYGHDLANTRNQDREKQIAPADVPLLAPAWTFSANRAGGAGDFTGTPIVTGGCLYAASNGGWVFAMNADTGQLVWKAQVPNGGGVNSSVAVSGGLVIAAVSKVTKQACTAKCDGPYLAAFDQATGARRWVSAPIDVQPGSDVYGSPLVFDGLVFEGVSGGAAELSDETDRYAFQGSFALLDAATGALVKKTWVIHPPHAPEDSFAGAGIWSTPAIDVGNRMAYVGAGNPFKPSDEHPHTNAILKIDLDRRRPTFGRIVGSYKGTVDQYVPQLSQLPCVDLPGNNAPYYPQGIGSCGNIDLDFGASPNLFKGPDGRLLVGAGQKSGVFHVFDAATMKRVWTSLVGPPSSVGGIVGSTAYDGSSFYGPVTVGGYVWSITADKGTMRWTAPTGDGAHWGNPVAIADDVLYTVDLKGALDGYEARTGVPLVHRPLLAGADTGGNPVASWGGVSVARNTVYASVGISGLPDGFIVALRPGGGEAPGLPAPPPLPGPGPGPAGVYNVVAVPGSVVATYATPIVVLPHGQPLSFVNGDVPQHDVVADNGAFRSVLVSTGGSAPVAGADKLAPGQYSFYCSLHRNMTGTLVVN